MLAACAAVHTVLTMASLSSAVEHEAANRVGGKWWKLHEGEYACCMYTGCMYTQYPHGYCL